MFKRTNKSRTCEIFGPKIKKKNEKKNGNDVRFWLFQLSSRSDDDRNNNALRGMHFILSAGGIGFARTDHAYIPRSKRKLYIRGGGGDGGDGHHHL